MEVLVNQKADLGGPMRVTSRVKRHVFYHGRCRRILGYLRRVRVEVLVNLKAGLGGPMRVTSRVKRHVFYNGRGS